MENLVITKSGILDFRIQGLVHSKVEQAVQGGVRQLVDKSESHPHQENLQADLRQNDVYKFFSEKTKTMICELGNVEYFELCAKRIPLYNALLST